MPKKKKSPLEASFLVVKSLAAADSSFRMKKMKDWVKSHLGLLRTELDQALVGLVEGLVVGLDLTPKGLQNKANFLGHAGLGVGLGPGLDPFLDPVLNMVSSHISRPISVAGTFSFPVQPRQRSLVHSSGPALVPSCFMSDPGPKDVTRELGSGVSSSADLCFSGPPFFSELDVLPNISFYCFKGCCFGRKTPFASGAIREWGSLSPVSVQANSKIHLES